MQPSRVVVLLLLVATLPAPLKVTGQDDLKVLVLDALDGKPQANVKVESLCAGPPSAGPPGNGWGKSAFTDDKGIARISYACSANQAIEIEVFPPNKKEQCGDDVNTNLNDVTSRGFISDPSAAGGIWCPTKVSRTLKPVPGQVTIFVKKPTWWQSHVAGCASLAFVSGHDFSVVPQPFQDLRAFSRRVTASPARDRIQKLILIPQPVHHLQRDGPSVCTPRQQRHTVAQPKTRFCRVCLHCLLTLSTIMRAALGSAYVFVR